MVCVISIPWNLFRLALGPTIINVPYALENNCAVECFILVKFVNYVIITFQGLALWQAGALFLEIMFYWNTATHICWCILWLATFQLQWQSWVGAAGPLTSKAWNITPLPLYRKSLLTLVNLKPSSLLSPCSVTESGVLRISHYDWTFDTCPCMQHAHTSEILLGICPTELPRTYVYVQICSSSIIHNTCEPITTLTSINSKMDK